MNKLEELAAAAVYTVAGIAVCYVANEILDKLIPVETTVDNPVKAIAIAIGKGVVSAVVSAPIAKAYTRGFFPKF